MPFLAGLSGFPITPTNDDGRVDVAALRALIARLCGAHANSIGLLGSTGTYMYLTREERRRAIETTVDEVDGRLPVIVGIGALRTDEAVKLAQDAKAAGAAAGLLASVSYTPLTDDEVFEHFVTIARLSGLPICIYDNPRTTHFRFAPDLVGRLSRVPGIVAVKSPAGEGQEGVRQLAALREAVPQGFSLGFSGNSNATEIMIAGADTWYSVLGGLFPATCLKIVRAVERGDVAEARKRNAALAPIWNLFRQYSALRVVYALAGLLGVCKALPPRPILPLPEAARREVAKAFEVLSMDIDQY